MPIEIHFPGEMYDYDAKYLHSQGETSYLCPPQHADAKIIAELKRIALNFYKATKAKDILRVDIIEAKGKYYALEANSLPGFTPDSLVPKAAEQSGLYFSQLCAKLVLSALNS